MSWTICIAFFLFFFLRHRAVDSADFHDSFRAQVNILYHIKSSTLCSSSDIIRTESAITSTTQVLAVRDCILNRNDTRLLRSRATLLAFMPDGQGGALHHISTTITSASSVTDLLTRLHLHCLIWTIIMQLGQPILAFASQSLMLVEYNSNDTYVRNFTDDQHCLFRSG